MPHSTATLTDLYDNLQYFSKSLEGVRSSLKKLSCFKCAEFDHHAPPALGQDQTISHTISQFNRPFSPIFEIEDEIRSNISTLPSQIHMTAPINHLPEHVLVDVMMHSQSLAVRARVLHAIHLSSVCRHWRMVSINAAPLWTEIDLRWCSRVPDDIAKALLWRTKEAPIDIKLSNYSDDTPSTSPFFTKEVLERTRSINFDFTRAGPANIEFMSALIAYADNASKFPLLKRFIFKPSYDPTYSHQTLEKCRPFLSCATPQTVSLEGVNRYSISVLLPTAYTQLLHLTLTGGRFTWSEMKGALLNCQNLLSMKVKDLKNIDTRPLRDIHVTLSHLGSLKITRCDLPTRDLLLSAIRAPTLQLLMVEVGFDAHRDGPVANFLRSTHAHTLILGLGEHTEDPLLSILPSLSSVHTLDLRSRTDAATATFLREIPTNSFPQLSELRLKERVECRSTREALDAFIRARSEHLDVDTSQLMMILHFYWEDLDWDKGALLEDMKLLGRGVKSIDCYVHLA